MNELVLVLRHPELKALYGQWLTLCAGERLPMAVELEPADFRRWLPDLVVIDVIRKSEFVYTYYGHAFTDAFGEDKVGRTVDELPERQRDVLRAEYDKVLATGLPSSRIYMADFEDGPQTWERLVLPFFTGEGEVEKLLVAAYRLSPAPEETES